MARRLRFTLLGSGSSGGVPRIDGNWGVCDPNEPKNHRTRCSALIEVWGEGANPSDEATTILIDTSPELRLQFLRAGVKRIDGLIYSHDHADQAHGIDDVRAIVARMRQRLPCYMDVATYESLTKRFAYIFERPEGSEYPPLLIKLHLAEHGDFVHIDGPGGRVDVQVIEQVHGNIMSYGVRVGGVAYCNDVNILPPNSLALLEDLELFVVDALRPTPHPSHANLEQALAWIDMLKPKQALLTNLHIDMDYQSLCAQLPPTIRPGYDNCRFETFID